ncbi:energy coupling factor transporter S component ThiW [Globicatella sulfidifaciens]|uniref:Energy coupling factor transporter S component ThiW n=1 Tax=Globicatella sulfidifaciens TaxID=136093 RepID=A0A7X8H0E5_9LACT|nr:energy coupling factor transporter S component ThiW [Globicatella sulfidifaciens]NLJ18446.1 energy coupling factor transporter S component ThiW [Globicatella sulfidifaciens]
MVKINTHKQTQKLMILSLMIALDVVLSPILRIEGMAPMSSVINIIAASFMSPLYTFLMALICGIIRMLMMGIPPLALTGAVFGALFAGFGYWKTRNFWAAALGEFIGTGVVGSLLSYPVMVWFTGVKTDLHWLIYTPRFMGACVMGAIAAFVLYERLNKLSAFHRMQQLFLTDNERVLSSQNGR